MNLLITFLQKAIGQGLAKMASGLSGAFPVSASFSRCSMRSWHSARRSSVQCSRRRSK